MSHRIHYTYEGRISSRTCSTLQEDLEDLQEINGRLWDELLGYMVATPPAYAKYQDEADKAYGSMPYPEFAASKLRELRQEIEGNLAEIIRIQECLEVLAGHPENVTEG